jgi:hypothetical protein
MDHRVLFEPEAARELAGVRSHREEDAIHEVIKKLRALGPALTPPHVKALRGRGGGLIELRPRAGRSDWRLLCLRTPSAFIVLAVTRHRDLDRAIGDAHRRRRTHDA